MGVDQVVGREKVLSQKKKILPSLKGQKKKIVRLEVLIGLLSKRHKS